MNESKEALEKRKNEIQAELDKGGRDLRLPLDRDPEEQAIEVEHLDVSSTFIENLRRELAVIEEKLAGFDD